MSSRLEVDDRRRTLDRISASDIMLLYGLECFALLKSDVESSDFAVTRFSMKLFRTSNIDIINDCRSNFSFMLPSEMIEIR